MCLKINSNGIGSYRGITVSVYVQLLAGDSDDELQWPFVGDVVLELVNWREDKGHLNKALPINVVCDLDKVTQGTAGNSFGFVQFISQSSLSYDPASNTEYLHNDSLLLRVKQVAVYSTPLLLKTPSWQDPSNVSQFMCEFTITEFSKRNQFNNRFFSPCFYTHKNGYKMCLEVYTSGCSSGKDTHISVYVQLMAGNNDDQLQWPFVGDIDIMLLNWREDNGHHKMTLSINAASGLIRVIDGVVGQSRGYPRFISLLSLFYNSSTNTEYLQDDCVRLTVNMATK